MHFETVLKHLIKLFCDEKVEYALIGGVALGAVGYQRVTVDLDFLILIKDLELVHKYLTTHGYECLNTNQEFASYVSKNPILGRVDLMLAHNDLTQKMLQRAIVKKVSDDLGSLRVILPEDLIGLKLIAAKNNPKRAGKDLIDVQEIIKNNKKHLDYSLLKDYFKLYHNEDKLKEYWKNATQ